MLKETEKYATAGSIESRTSGDWIVSVPPRWAAAGPRTATHRPSSLSAPSPVGPEPPRPRVRAERDCGQAARAGIDPRHRAARLVRDPDRVPSHGHAAGCLTDADGLRDGAGLRDDPPH